MTFLSGIARPAKQMQRLMVMDVCRRLDAFAPLPEYQYIGFGGFEFVDFDLAHRLLHIDRLISIERDSSRKARYEFNKPYRGIEIQFGHSNEILPELDYSGLSICWLDYFDHLEATVIQDVSDLALRLQPGSMLIVTLNAHPDRPADSRREKLAGRVGEVTIPPSTTDARLAQWGLADIQKQILLNELQTACLGRADAAEFRSVADIYYSDTCQMQTSAFVLVSPGLVRSLEAARFSELDQVREEPVRVVVPSLTRQEMAFLNAQLPVPPGGELVAEWLEPRDLTTYRELYKWYLEATG